MLSPNRGVFVRITQQELVAVLPGDALDLLGDLSIEGVGDSE